MKKTDIIQRLETGDIVVSRTEFSWKRPISWLSAAIRFFAKTKYNHAELIVFNWGKAMSNEAVGRGVLSEPFGFRSNGKKIMVLRPNFKVSEMDLAITANSIIGTRKYDVIGLIHQAIYLTTGKWIGKTGEEAGKRMYCFEYVSWVYKEQFPEWWKVTPKEVIKSNDFELVLITNVE